MVYVTQERSDINMLPAKEYGEVTILLGPKQLVFSAEEAVKELKHRLLLFDDRDFILPIGDPAIIGLATAIAANMNEGRVKFLKWDKQEKRYYSVEANIGRT